MYQAKTANLCEHTQRSVHATSLATNLQMSSETACAMKHHDPQVTCCRLLQVMEIRQQANKALQQAQTEITEAEQAAAKAHQQVLSGTYNAARATACWMWCQHSGLQQCQRHAHTRVTSTDELVT